MNDDLNGKMAAIARSIAAGTYRYTVHAARRRIVRNIRRDDIEAAVANAAIIEDYPAHHYGPACLMLGRTADGEPLHILCSFRPMVGIITGYEPDPNEREPDLTRRRQTPP